MTEEGGRMVVNDLSDSMAGGMQFHDDTFITREKGDGIEVPQSGENAGNLHSHIQASMNSIHGSMKSLKRVGIDQTTQETMLAQKREEMRKVEMELNQTKEKTDKLLESLKQKQMEFSHKQSVFRKQVEQFQRFIVESDAKRSNKERQIDEEKKEVQRRISDITKKRDQLHKLREIKRKIQGEVESLRCFQEYLQMVALGGSDDSVTPQVPSNSHSMDHERKSIFLSNGTVSLQPIPAQGGGASAAVESSSSSNNGSSHASGSTSQLFGSVSELLQRYEILSQTEKKLSRQIDHQNESMASMTAELSSLSNDSQNKVLVKNSLIANSLLELETVEQNVVDLTAEYNRVSEISEQSETEFHQIKLSIENTYDRVFLALALKAPAHRREFDENKATPHQSKEYYSLLLDEISSRLQDFIDIVKHHGIRPFKHGIHKS